MIFGHIQQAETDFSWLPAPFQTVLSHLKATDFESKSVGAYELQGRDIYVQVMDVTTKAHADTRPEVHQKYIDVQFIWRGREKIGVVIDNGSNDVAEDSLADRDVLFYRDVENESALELHPGNFAVFFPSDVHRPLCQVDGPEAVRKVVVKIAVALLA
ncbi:MAG TPA: YhcH/YjgK/YiaL family protein [Telmatospirillum sp.]|nr:YhcH/YjgK/YiaL family protein [Telmatospirillum sp.]